MRKAAPNVRVTSRASRGGPGRLWAPRGAPGVGVSPGRSRLRHDLRSSVTGPRGTSQVLMSPGTLRGDVAGALRCLPPIGIQTAKGTSGRMKKAQGTVTFHESPQLPPDVAKPSIRASRT